MARSRDRARGPEKSQREIHCYSSPLTITSFKARTPTILDDIASSRRTIIWTIEQLRNQDASTLARMIIHLVFSGDGCDEALDPGAARFITTDSIPHSTNAIGLRGHWPRRPGRLYESTRPASAFICSRPHQPPSSFFRAE